MSILAKLFGGVTGQAPSPAQAANPALQQQQQLPTPGNIPAVNAMPANPANPTVPATVEPTKAPEGLDKYSDIWNIKPEDMPKAPESVFAGVTPEQIAAVAAKTDFSKAVTPDMMAAISGGGEGAVAAMMQAMNAVAQQGYATNAQASIKLIETALAKQQETFTAALPDLIKNQNVANNLRTSNPIFKHPAAAPILDMFTKQLQLKNPTASAEQIQTQAQEYLLSLATTANPTKTVVDPKAPKETDWSDFM